MLRRLLHGFIRWNSRQDNENFPNLDLQAERRQQEIAVLEEVKARRRALQARTGQPVDMASGLAGSSGIPLLGGARGAEAASRQRPAPTLQAFPSTLSIGSLAFVGGTAGGAVLPVAGTGGGGPLLPHLAGAGGGLPNGLQYAGHQRVLEWGIHTGGSSGPTSSLRRGTVGPSGGNYYHHHSRPAPEVVVWPLDMSKLAGGSSPTLLGELRGLTQGMTIGAGGL